MRFVLIGQHPDGLDMAQALVQNRAAELAAYAGPAAGAEHLHKAGLTFNLVGELEEALALDIDLAIVADDLDHRAAVLRRAVQSELHVLGVHPADLIPDIAYECVMIQQDTKKVLLPILPFRLAPGLVSLRDLCRRGTVGRVEIIEAEFRQPPRPVISWEQSPLVWLWDVLRFLAGEIGELSALSTRPAQDIGPADPLNLNGRFVDGPLFRVLVSASGPADRLLVRGECGQAELVLAEGWRGGPALLAWSAGGETQREEWPTWDPWPALADAFLNAVAGKPQPLGWQDATRCLELFDAARRSAKKQRAVPMLYEEFTEEATFKSVMTGLGCSLLVLLIVLLVVANWLPWILYAVLPVLAAFLGLQGLRWLARENKA